MSASVSQCPTQITACARISLANLRRSSLTLARNSQLRALSRLASKSLARRRLIEPSQGALDNATSRQNHKACRRIAALDGLDCPVTDLVEGSRQLGPAVAAVGKDVAPPRIEKAGGGQDQGRAVTILDIGGMNHSRDGQAECVGQQVALAAVDLLTGIIAARAAGLGGLDRLAVDNPGAGLASRPLASRTRMTKPWLIRCHNPSSRQP